jgi:sugar lactone lactonase YvrE
VLVRVAEELGAPDGMAVDADGDLWVAILRGGQVHHYCRDGVLRRVLAVPAREIPKVHVHGLGSRPAGLSTATEDWSEEQRHTGRAVPGPGPDGKR